VGAKPESAYPMHKATTPRGSKVRIPRFDSETGRPRRRWAALAGGIVLALFLGSGIAVAATGAAQAHDPDAVASCTGVTVIAEWYNTDNFANDGIAQPNWIDVSIDGVPQARTYFGASADGANAFRVTYPASSSTVDHTYVVTVFAWDDPDGHKGYTKTFTKYSTKCDPPTITASATPCNVQGSTTAISAQFGALVAGRSYTLDLIKGGSVIQSSVITAGFSVFPGAGESLPASWATQAAGGTYTVRITDNTNTSLTAQADVVSVGCPTSLNVSVDILQCAAAGQAGQFTIVAAITSGREYQVIVYKDGAEIDNFTATLTGDANGLYKKSYVGSPNSSYSFSIRDTKADPSVMSTSGATKFLPCPDMPAEPALTVQQCTATAGPSDASLVINLTKLVVDRSYTVTVTGGPTVVPTVNLNPTLADKWTSAKLLLEPGTYTVTVTDTLNTAFTASKSLTIAPCPRQQSVGLTSTTCTVPGGSSDVSATVTNFVVGRTYTIALTQNGLPVAGQPVSEDFTPTTLVAPVFTYAKLTPGVAYRVIVTDKATVTDNAIPDVITAADITPTECPGNPGIAIQFQCLLTGTSTMTVDVSKLVAGQTYTISVISTATGLPVPGIADAQVSGNTPAQSVVIKGVPNGKQYTVTVANATKTLTAAATVVLKLCKIELPTLAYTGASTTTPTLAGIGFLQFGLVLVGISLARRRSGARKA